MLPVLGACVEGCPKTLLLLLFPPEAPKMPPVEEPCFSLLLLLAPKMEEVAAAGFCSCACADGGAVAKMDGAAAVLPVLPPPLPNMDATPLPADAGTVLFRGMEDDEPSERSPDAFAFADEALKGGTWGSSERRFCTPSLSLLSSAFALKGEEKRDAAEEELSRLVLCCEALF